MAPIEGDVKLQVRLHRLTGAETDGRHIPQAGAIRKACRPRHPPGISWPNAA